MKTIDKKRVLEMLETRGMHVMELLARIGLPKSARDALVDVLDELRDLGLVTSLPGRRYRKEKQRDNVKPPTAPRGEDPGGGATTFGRLQMHPRGFGFVSAE